MILRARNNWKLSTGFKPNFGGENSTKDVAGSRAAVRNSKVFSKGLSNGSCHVKVISKPDQNAEKSLTGKGLDTVLSKEIYRGKEILKLDQNSMEKSLSSRVLDSGLRNLGNTCSLPLSKLFLKLWISVKLHTHPFQESLKDFVQTFEMMANLLMQLHLC